MSQRELTGHKVNPANDKLSVFALDEPGPGGASHLYAIAGYTGMPTDFGRGPRSTGVLLEFQNGPIAEAGVNGITHEALLAVLIDRLEGFQAGPFRHPCNEEALSFLRGAQQQLQERTLQRMSRGVEGTHVV